MTFVNFISKYADSFNTSDILVKSLDTIYPAGRLLLATYRPDDTRAQYL